MRKLWPLLLAIFAAACGGPHKRPAKSAPPGAARWGLVGVESISASSLYTEPAGGEPAGGAETHVYDPPLALDPDGLGTSWCEGAEGPGLGETITMRMRMPTAIGDVAITPLQDLDRATYARIKRLDVIADGKPIPSAAQPGGAFIARVGGAAVQSIAVRIAEVEPGEAPLGCIANIGLTGPTGAPLRPLLVSSPRAMDRLLPDLLEIDEVLRTCDGARLQGSIIFPLHTGSSPIAAASPADFAGICRRRRVTALKVTPAQAIESLRQERPDYEHKLGAKAAVARVAPDGKERWRFLPSQSTRWSEVHDAALDPAGDVIIAGTFRDTLALSAAHRYHSGYWGGFLAKLDGATGAVKWARSITARSAAFTNLAIAPNGDVFVGGNAAGATSVGGAALPSGSIVQGRPNPRVVIARYTGAGKHVWSIVGEDDTYNVSGMSLHGDTLFVVRSKSFVIQANPDGSSTVRSAAGILALSAADGSARYARWFGQSPPAPGHAVSPPELVDPALQVWDNRAQLLNDGSELHVTFVAKGPLRHGSIVYPPAERAVYLLSYSMDGEPRAARRVVSPYFMDLEVSGALVQGDLALLGLFKEQYAQRIPPYDVFLMRVRRGAPSGATFTVD